MSDGQAMISSLKTAIECQHKESCNWLITPTNVSSLIGFDAQMRLFKIHAKKISSGSSKSSWAVEFFGFNS